MKYKHLFWAVILISIGLLFILRNLNIVHFSWIAFWRLWPLILLFWGIAILPIKDAVKFILLGAVVLFTFLFINRLTERPWYFHFHDGGDHYSWRWDDNDDNDNSTSDTYKEQNLMVPYDSLTKEGTLSLDAAAGNFTIGGNTTEFLSFSKKGNIGNYELTTTDNKGIKNISLRMQEGSSTRHLNKNEVNIKLNPNPVWDMRLDIGAADMDLDLSGYRIDTANIDAGASSIKMKLGEKYHQTHVIFNAGASSLKMSIPKAAGCKVSSESFLASRDFEGFTKKGDNTWETDNYASAKCKINIVVKTAVSSIEINRY